MINVSKLYCGVAGQSDRLRYGHGGAMGPIVVFNCTARCNLRCMHCYSGSGASCAENELSTAEAKKLLAGCAEIKAPVVLFSGGEPMLREDLFELLAEAKRLGLRTVLSTNGTLIDKAAAEKLAEQNVGYIGISVDGQEQFHDVFRKSAGSFRKAMAGYESCNKAGLRTGLRFTITKANASQAGSIFDIAVQHKIRRLCFYHLVQCGRAKDIGGEAPSKETTREVMDTVLASTARHAAAGDVDEVLTVGNHADGPYLLLKLKDTDTVKFEEAKRLLLAAGGNRIGQGIVCVDWWGGVHPDQFWRQYSVGSIREKSFAEIWNNNDEPVLAKLRNKSTFADKRCLKCKWFELCKGNYRFIGDNPADENWLNEPPCYLTDAEIGL